MIRKMIAIVLGCAALPVAVFSCSTPPTEEVETDDSESGASADGDTDSDTNSDMDTDTDTDADTDADSDSDSDTDTTGTAASWVNIIEVVTSGNEGGYTFDVTIESSDLDCTQFADWWEVITEDGTLVYRRILTHPHTEGMSGNPVTRGGGPVAITADQTVIIRGHMNNAGYIGLPMRGSVNGGFVQTNEIAGTFASDLADDEPQPVECIPEEVIMGGG